MSNLGIPGFGSPPPPPPLPQRVRPPAQQSDLDDMVARVDKLLGETRYRQLFSANDVHNLLLDVRNVLDRLTSPAVLRDIADQLDRHNLGLFDAPLPLPGE